MTTKEGGLRGSIRNVGVEVDAIPDSVIDDFNDGDLAEYSNTGNVGVTTSTALEGTHSAQVNTGTTDAGTRAYSLENDGLEYYPSKGDTFSALLWEGSGGDDELPAFYFGVDSNTNGIDGYLVWHQPTFDEWGIGRVDDGSGTTLSRPALSLSTDQTYEYVVEWHDGSGSESDDTIKVTVYETDETADLSSELGRSSQLDNATITDSNHATNTGVGLGTNSSSVNGENRIDRYWYLGSVE